MRILIADDYRPTRDAATRWLSDRGHTVAIADSLSALLGAMTSRKPDVVVLDSEFARTSVTDLLRRMRACSSGAAPYVVAQLRDRPTAEIPTVLAAGVNDFVRAPCAREELVARVEMLSGSGGGATKQAPAPAQRAIDWSSNDDVSERAYWKQANRIIHDALGSTAGVALQSTRGEIAGKALAAARIPLVGAGGTPNLDLCLRADIDALRGIAAEMIGEPQPSPGDLDDVLRELANQAAGALKRAAGEEAWIYTLGLPATVAAASIVGGRSGQEQLFSYGPVSGVPVISALLRTTPKALKSVPARSLSEGMVLVRDLHNRSGALLIPAGTRLTSQTASRIVAILGESTVIEVSVAA